jgi:N-acetylglucosamine-6-phosphate deacetylase
MRAKGLADGESELGGQLVIVKNGEARLVDGTLAGSVLRMNVAV